MKIRPVAIKNMMAVRLMTQEELAQAAGVSRQTINTLLLKGSCSAKTARKIAQALNVEPVAFVKELEE